MKVLNRRNFLGRTAGAISGAALFDLNEPLSVEQMAHALREVAGRYAGRKAPFFSVHDTTYRQSSVEWAMENLRYSSVDEIQQLLKPLFEGGES